MYTKEDRSNRNKGKSLLLPLLAVLLLTVENQLWCFNAFNLAYIIGGCAPLSLGRCSAPFLPGVYWPTGKKTRRISRVASFPCSLTMVRWFWVTWITVFQGARLLSFSLGNKSQWAMEKKTQAVIYEKYLARYFPTKNPGTSHGSLLTGFPNGQRDHGKMTKEDSLLIISKRKSLCSLPHTLINLSGGGVMMLVIQFVIKFILLWF